MEAAQLGMRCHCPVLGPHRPSVRQRCHRGLGLTSTSSRSLLLPRKPGRTRDCTGALAAAPELTAGRVQGVQDEAGHIVEVDGPALKVELEQPRRRLLVAFTCNKCGARTERLVNPLAWSKGTVFVQCANCDVWHNIRDEAGLIKEYRLKDENNSSVASTDQAEGGS